MTEDCNGITSSPGCMASYNYLLPYASSSIDTMQQVLHFKQSFLNEGGLELKSGCMQ